VRILSAARGAAQLFSCPWSCERVPQLSRGHFPQKESPTMALMPMGHDIKKESPTMALMPMGHDILYLPPRATPWDDNQGIGLVTFFR
jgi:hypothetical protein